MRRRTSDRIACRCGSSRHLAPRTDGIYSSLSNIVRLALTVNNFAASLALMVGNEGGELLEDVNKPFVSLRGRIVLFGSNLLHPSNHILAAHGCTSCRVVAA